MTFQISRIAAAVGLAVAASSVLANPLNANVDVSNYVSGPGVTDVYIAGSSAVDLALTKFIASACAPNTLDTYRTDAGGKTYYLWTCETSSSTGFNLASGNTKLAIHKNTNSSADGVNFVANGAGTMAYLQVSDLNGSSTDCAINPQSIAATSNIPQYNYYVCGTTAGAAGVGTLSHLDRFGFSDSEPKQFNSAVASQLTSVYPLSIVFGVPVSLNVRNALQASQGLSVGSDAESAMPSLTTGQINSIYTNHLTTWSQLGITVSSSDNSIYWVRRSAGSGTTRAFDVSFIGDFCVPGALPITTAAATLVTQTISSQCNSVGNGGAQSLQAGDSDDMAACVASFNTNGVGAIGYLSTDYQPQATDGYRWIKIDGLTPKLLNVTDGKWRDWSEEALNYNKATALTGDDASFYAAVKATSANGGVLSDIANGLTQPLGGWTGGVMGALPSRQNGSGWGLSATPALAVPRSDASVLAYPANPATRAQSLGYNLCNVPQPVANYSAE